MGFPTPEVRGRIEVQRGWKTLKTLLVEGKRIHYNFVKPHQALDGRTSAETVGIGIGGTNKWMRLIEETLAKEG